MKNIFNKKLFFEALRQIRIPLAFFFGAMIGCSGIFTFVNIFSAKQDYDIYHTISTIPLEESIMHLCICYVAIIPIFVILLFRFMTKRNSSDFYHAIPLTRTCIMFTYIAAILISSVVLLVLSAIIPIIGYSLAGKYLEYTSIYAVYNMINTLACMILVLGATLLACSLTGTFSTNIIFTLVILFGPRFFIYLMTTILTYSLNEILVYEPDYGFFSPNINLIFGQFCEMFLYEYDAKMNYITGATFYTFALGIIYIILAFIAFNKRKSEQAESSARNPFAHNLIRLCIGLFFGLAIVNDLFTFKGDMRFDIYLQIGTYIIVGIALMILYEILTTRKIKRILNVLATVPIVAVICVIINFSLSMVHNGILNYAPTANDVKYIQYLTYEDAHYEEFDELNYYDYRINQVEFDNSEIIKFITEAYADELESYKQFLDSENHRWFGDSIGKNNMITIRFVTNKKTIERIVFLSDKEYEQFRSLVFSDDDYKAIFKSLPKNYRLSSASNIFTEDEVMDIAKVFDNELKDLSAEDATLVLGSSYDGMGNSIYDFRFRVSEGTTRQYFHIYITPSTPKALAKTLELLSNKINEQNESINAIADMLENIESYKKDTSFFWFSARVIDLETYTPITGIHFNEYSKEEFGNYTSYGYDDYDTLKKDTINFLTEREDSYKNAKYLVFVDCDSNNDGEWNTFSSFFFSNDTDFINGIVEYNNEQDAYYKEQIIYE